MKLLHYKPSVPNFGDDLNACLWSELAPALFEDEDASTAFVGIGTIVGLDPGESRRLHVFSSGAGYAPLDRWRGLDVDYHCVRGPVTARLLGLPSNRVLTDGALLAPVLPRFGFGKNAAVTRGASAMRGGGNVVVVPHFETIAHPGWRHAAQLAGFELVDPRGTPEGVIAALAKARLVLTESLHGAILADTYGVPWRGFAVSRNFSTAKWADWTSSLRLDVEIAMVPPPDAMPLLRFGKRAEPFGATVWLDPEAALREFRGRIAQRVAGSWTKARAKRFLEVVPQARRLLGFTPERTAQALHDLAQRPPFISSENLRHSLRAQMLDRLDQLVRKEAPVLAG